MIEKINAYDKIIERTGGKTLDMSAGVRRKRTYTMREKSSHTGGPKIPGDAHHRHLAEYANLVACFQRIKTAEMEQEKFCYLNVQE